jgi:hypothetical protein
MAFSVKVAKGITSASDSGISPLHKMLNNTKQMGWGISLPRIMSSKQSVCSGRIFQDEIRYTSIYERNVHS